MDYHFSDFTEENYRRLLQCARAHYEFVSFQNWRRDGAVCLWRHDVDLSVHRALRISAIEADEGIAATYFIHLQSPFYNVFEGDIISRLRCIRARGHEIGLHFDPAHHASIGAYETETVLSRERQILEQLIDAPVRAFSIHNPDQHEGGAIDDEEIAGLTNAYGQALQCSYTYCSDSNGYWRHKRLHDVLHSGRPERLHVLTHPGWWTPEVLSPYDRILRCVEGRASRQRTNYVGFLEHAGRENIR